MSSARSVGWCSQRRLRSSKAGKNDARPELAKALTAARRRRGVLVVATLSRLGRRVSFVSTLMEQGVPFACADAPDDEPFVLHVKAAFAEEERRKISTRTKAALAVAKTRGVKLGKPENLTREARIAGAATVKARAEVQRAAIWPQIATARAEGLSVRAIAERVGVSPMSISRMLRANSMGQMPSLYDLQERPLMNPLSLGKKCKRRPGGGVPTPSTRGR